MSPFAAIHAPIWTQSAFLRRSNLNKASLRTARGGSLRRCPDLSPSCPHPVAVRQISAEGLKVICQTRDDKGTARSAREVRTNAVASEPRQASGSAVKQLYRKPFLSPAAEEALLRKAQALDSGITNLVTEVCFNLALSSPLSAEKEKVLSWLLSETFGDTCSAESFIGGSGGAHAAIVEVGPRMNFTTAWSSNAVSICTACGVPEVERLERSRRYLLVSESPLSSSTVSAFAALVHDRMTECVYSEPLASFDIEIEVEPVRTIPVLAEGRKAIERIDSEMGLAFDDWDMDYYTDLFLNKIQRDPTTVELFDMAQSNSEHSRHWFFKGKFNIDGEEISENLFKIITDTLDAKPENSVIAFKDNSSAIRGSKCSTLLPTRPGGPAELCLKDQDYDLLFTAETHNFPSAVAPFPGAETGAGGRIRDTHATGKGSIVVASTAGYCVGNLYMDNGLHPWEDESFEYPSTLATPLEILIDASNGCSDYGNKFGEPLICGFTRTFGLRLPDDSRREWIKPIMFSGGIGQIDHRHIEKSDGEVENLIVKIGGPAYRIGLGGGAASSKAGGEGTGDADLDFNAVQRGDAEMAQKLNRVVRACIELGDDNPIVQIHDQGAGGNCNVVKEIMYPLGATVDIRSIKVGDNTMSVLEIWGSEYQENNAILIKPESEALLRSFCERERIQMSVLGSLDGRGRVTLIDSAASPGTPTPEDLDLEDVLGKLPPKTFVMERMSPVVRELDLQNASVSDALDRVLKLPSVGSKRFLTNKVDRSVTGLVAQQQCCGSLQLPVADYAVIAQSHFGLTGGVTTIGEQPIKGLIDPKAMARLSAAEAITNMMCARVSALSDVKASGNWMYAAKLPGQGAQVYDAAVALRETLIDLGVAIDGGKDSLSMAAKAGGETVMAPGAFVLSCYVTSPDITKGVTPDLKLADDGGVLLHLDLAEGKRRLGGSALAHVYGQVGSTVPDLDSADRLVGAFEVTQELLEDRLIAAGHDISDGGIAVTLLEMSFAGNCGIKVDLNSEVSPFEELFAEELGLVLEVKAEDAARICAKYRERGVKCTVIGSVQSEQHISISVANEEVVSDSVGSLRDAWEASAFALEELQVQDVSCVEEEKSWISSGKGLTWNIPESFTLLPDAVANARPKVAILREEGSNGDREMSSAVHMAGMQPWDVTMSDLLSGRVSLETFQGIVFVGGFSYADVLDSAKGWAGSIRYNKDLLHQFQAFYQRSDTFSLGVCNGCQLMALLGWIPGGADLEAQGDLAQPRFIHNKSGRFESRFVTVGIEPSNAVLLKGMENTRVGVWCAHGEGRSYFPEQSIMQDVLANSQAPLRYVDGEGQPTQRYPLNPNGSPEGIAALCSQDGRHLAMMPHPERCFMMWQMPYVPKDVQADWPIAGPSPWLRMFQNAREWCLSR